MKSNDKQTIAPLLSIIIPTHNRSQYAIPCINSILNYVHGKYEVIVHDTSTNYELSHFAQSVTDQRLRYYHCEDQLSMTDNHNRAFEYAEGHFLILIGDDDTINPEILKICEFAKKNNLKAVSQNICSNYVWPDFKSKMMGSKHASRLYFNRSITGKIKIIDTKSALTKTLNNACQGADNLPKIYHGIVSKTVYDQVIQDHGKFFFGTSPDISGALVVASYIKEYLEIDYPISIPGASGGSNTGRAALSKHKGTIADDPHTKRFKNINWNECIPKFVSPETIWSQAAIETFENINERCVDEFNWNRLYALCLINHKDYFKEIATSMNFYYGKNILSQKLKLIKEIISVILFKFLKLAIRVSLPTAAGYRKHICNLKDVSQVPPHLSIYLKKYSLTIKLQKNIKKYQQ